MGGRHLGALFVLVALSAAFVLWDTGEPDLSERRSARRYASSETDPGLDAAEPLTKPSSALARETLAREDNAGSIEGGLAAVVDLAEPVWNARIRGKVTPGPEITLLPGDSLADQQLECSAPGLRREVREGEAMHVSYGGARSFVLLAEDGAFELSGLPSGVELELWLGTPFGELRESVAPLRPGELRQVELVLGREGGWRRVQGVVRDEYGQPAPNVQVSLDWLDAEREGASHLSRDSTGEDGSFELRDLPRGVCRLVARGPDYALTTQQDVDLTSGDVSGVELHIKRGVDLLGEVVWPDGERVRWGQVEFEGKQGTLDDGALSLRGLTQELGELRIRTRRRGSLGRLEQSVLPGSSPTRWVLDEVRTVDVRIETVDPRGVRVHTEVRGSFRNGVTWEEALVTPVEEIGAFRAEFPPGPALGVVTSSRHSPREVHITVTGPEVVRIELEEGLLLRGTVLDPSGRPCARAMVWNLNTSARVEAAGDGSFEMLLGASAERIVARQHGFGPSLPLELDPGAGSAIQERVLRLREACELAGEVLGLVDEDTAVVLDLDGELEFAVLAETGLFRFTDLAPGTYAVWVERGDAQGAPVQVSLAPGSVPRIQLRAP